MKPSIPKGTRDFSPTEMVKRNFIFKTIREVFEKYGYQPIETPAVEKLSTLEGKYGEEGDKLLFRILNSGPVIDEINNKSGIKISDITEKGLRYDLTVPFARYVVQHQNEITFPFKRYQIQPVWRADRPQKGRYREFYQCDADVIGSDSLLNEVELVQMIVEIFEKLNIDVIIRINNRKILTGIAELFGVKEKFMDLIIAIDKYEKIQDKIYEELEKKGFDEKIISKIKNFMTDILSSDFGKERIQSIKKYFENIPIALSGFEELDNILSKLAVVYKSRTKILDIRNDISLARGLNYYTGAIFEVKASALGGGMGSICGGGRYDDLTGVFGLPNVSGVGISFGIDRIFDVMNELNLFEKIDYTSQTTKLLFAHLGEKERDYCISLAVATRSAGINTEIYPDVTKKISKQFDYANKKQIPFVVVIGTEEMNSGELTLKDMSTGEQKKIKIDKLIEKLSRL